ncbi:MAG: dTDP-glucose 4,6-dehydratase [Gemmatimonadaceae bacterium]|jgi:dTDP-glucose 4,6-dehydratase|nr:dTDP-glucose 4,6-dehydratase [Gemmatimonadaceae bacterium]
MPDLLVTGGAGFIGANFVHYWLREHHASRVVVLDALTYAGNLANLDAVRGDARFTFVHGDICTEGLAAGLLRDHALDTIVHFAAESHVDRSILGPDAFLRANITGTHELLKAARQVWLDEGRMPVERVRFHHVSTDEVYGSLGFDDPPFTETTPYAPNSPYSASKAASDHLVRAYHHTYGLPVTTSNCSNNYGPWHFPEKLIPLLIVNVLDGRTIPVYGDGRNVRDWLYVEDHARAIDAILGRGRVGEVYNVGGRAEAANIDIVRRVCALVDDRLRADAALRARFPQSPAATGGDATSLITFVADRPGHDRRYAIAPDKLAAETGWAPRETLATGLARTVDWYLAQEPWWRGIMDGSYRDWITTHYATRERVG